MSNPLRHDSLPLLKLSHERSKSWTETDSTLTLWTFSDLALLFPIAVRKRLSRASA